jgi:hypothetical protein
VPAIEVYTEGNKIIVRATWETESVPGSEEYDTPTDPTTVTFTARRRTPAGQWEDGEAYVFGTDGEVTKVSTGVFEFASVPDPGRWAVHAQGTGNAHGSDEIEFEIDASQALAA